LARPSFKALAGAWAALWWSGAALAQEAKTGGVPPAYLTTPLSRVPNEQAMVRRFFMPGLDEGYTPQGLVYAAGAVHVVGYGPGGCRLYSLSPHGKLQGQVDVPACRHGGGLAALGGGRFVVIDSRALFIVQSGRVMHKIVLEKPLVGSFGDFDGKDLWIGAYVKDGPGTLWRFSPAALKQGKLSEADASSRITIPAKAQGMVFHGGQMWLTFSGATFGRLSRLDSATGQEVARYDMPAGIEDLGSDGRLIWSVSEAGAKKYLGWKTHFPLIFALDPALLK